jgi:uncharacterized RDD family membrane protein YckC
MKPPKFGTRFAAFHLDALVFTVAFESVHIWLLQHSPRSVSTPVLILLFAALTLVLFVVPTVLWGQTLGKKLYSLKVVPAKNPSGSLNWSQVIERELVFKSISTFFLGAGLWRARHEPEGKGWHDTHAGTRVVSLASGRFPWLAKLFETVASILTVLVGVALTLWAMLFTKLPLPMLEEQLRSAGIAVHGLQGSLAGGLVISSLRSEGPSGKFSFENLEFKIDPVATFSEKRVVFEKISIGSGVLDVGGRLSASSFTKTLLNSVEGVKLKIARLEVRELKLGVAVPGAGDAQAPSVVHRFKIDSLLSDENGISAADFSSQVDELSLQGNGLHSLDGTLRIDSLSGCGQSQKAFQVDSLREDSIATFCQPKGPG